MNITEQDLMVGDWVQYGDIHPIKTRVLGINSVDKGKHWHIDAEPENPNGVRVVPMNAVEPIPLTAEILEKNGFVKGEEVSDTPPYDQDEEGNMYYSFRGELKFWGWWQPDNTYYIPANAMGDIIIRYVHELQNAMRLAGIDKEITI